VLSQIENCVELWFAEYSGSQHVALTGWRQTKWGEVTKRRDIVLAVVEVDSAGVKATVKMEAKSERMKVEETEKEERYNWSKGRQQLQIPLSLHLSWTSEIQPLVARG
jgi:hypothetical protein